MVGGVNYGRYFTAEQLAAYVEGPLHRHSQKIESHLAVFVVRGLIIPVSRPRADNVGPAFAACYRLPVHGKKPAKADDGAEATAGDDVRAAVMEAQRRLATGKS
jgi:hypothetical protein